MRQYAAAGCTRSAENTFCTIRSISMRHSYPELLVARAMPSAISSRWVEYAWASRGMVLLNSFFQEARSGARISGSRSMETKVTGSGMDSEDDRPRVIARAAFPPSQMVSFHISSEEMGARCRDRVGAAGLAFGASSGV